MVTILTLFIIITMIFLWIFVVVSLCLSSPRCYGDKTNGSPMVSNTTKQQTKWIVFVFGRLLILLSISLHWSRQSICLCFWQNTLGPIGGNQCQKISWWVVLLPLFWRIFWIFLSDIYGFVMMTSTTKEQTKFRTLHQRSSLSSTQVFQSSPLWEEFNNTNTKTSPNPRTFFDILTETLKK